MLTDHEHGTGTKLNVRENSPFRDVNPVPFAHDCTMTHRAHVVAKIVTPTPLRVHPLAPIELAIGTKYTQNRPATTEVGLLRRHRLDRVSSKTDQLRHDLCD